MGQDVLQTLEAAGTWAGGSRGGGQPSASCAMRSVFLPQPSRISSSYTKQSSLPAKTAGIQTEQPSMGTTPWVFPSPATTLLKAFMQDPRLTGMPSGVTNHHRADASQPQAAWESHGAGSRRRAAKHEGLRVSAEGHLRASIEYAGALRLQQRRMQRARTASLFQREHVQNAFAGTA